MCKVILLKLYLLINLFTCQWLVSQCWLGVMYLYSYMYFLYTCIIYVIIILLNNIHTTVTIIYCKYLFSNFIVYKLNIDCRYIISRLSMWQASNALILWKVSNHQIRCSTDMSVKQMWYSRLIIYSLQFHLGKIAWNTFLSQN